MSTSPTDARSISVSRRDSDNVCHPWRVVGIASSTVGLGCYALSPSFKQLYGEWSLLKSIHYAAVSLIVSCIMLYPKKLEAIRISTGKEYHVIIWALMLTSMYSAYCDEHLKGKPDALNVISTGAFALMSVSLSEQVKFGFEVGVSAFFLGALAVQLAKISLILVCDALVFYYIVYCLRSYLSSPSDTAISTDRRNEEARGVENLSETEQQGSTQAEQQTEQRGPTQAEQQTEQQGSTQAEQQTQQRESTEADQQESTDPIAEQNRSVTSQPITEKTEKNETVVSPEGTELKVEQQADQLVFADSIAKQNEHVSPKPTIKKIEENGTMLPQQGTGVKVGKQVLINPIAEQNESVTSTIEKTEKNGSYLLRRELSSRAKNGEIECVGVIFSATLKGK